MRRKISWVLASSLLASLSAVAAAAQDGVASSKLESAVELSAPIVTTEVPKSTELPDVPRDPASVADVIYRDDCPMGEESPSPMDRYSDFAKKHRLIGTA